MRLSFRSRGSLAALAGAIVVLSGLLGVGAAVAAGTDDDVPTETNGGSIVEDYGYPGAEGIETAHPEVHLVSGDGHIVFVECSTAAQSGVGRITVEISSRTKVCFSVLAASGVLNLRVAGVDSIDARKASDAGGKSAEATIQPEGGSATTIALKSNVTTPVGKGVDSNSPATTLLQLVVKDQ
jgi:hypothetical protein